MSCLNYDYEEFEEISDSIYREYENNIHINELSIGCNRLTIIDPRIRIMTRLEHLHLFENFIEHLPSEIGNLVNLISLSINDNRLACIPHEIGNLTNLKKLDLGYNMLACIPHEIGNLTKLLFLNTPGNNILSVSPRMANIKNAVFVNLSDNPIAADVYFPYVNIIFPSCKTFLDRKKYLTVYLALAHECGIAILSAISVNYPLITMDNIYSLIPRTNIPYRKDF